MKSIVEEALARSAREERGEAPRFSPTTNLQGEEVDEELRAFLEGLKTNIDRKSTRLNSSH